MAGRILEFGTDGFRRTKSTPTRLSRLQSRIHQQSAVKACNCRGKRICKRWRGSILQTVSLFAYPTENFNVAACGQTYSFERANWVRAIQPSSPPSPAASNSKGAPWLLRRPSPLLAELSRALIELFGHFE